MIEICPLRQSLLDCEGHALVLGGPGSGKTTIALRKAVKRINEGLLSGQKVMFLSFSRSAVARIAEASKTETAKDQRSLLSIQTFHSFFWELLSTHAYLLGTPKKIRILLPHDERSLSNGAKEGELLWPAWLLERERLWKEEGRIAFDFFAPCAADLLQNSAVIRQLIAQKYPLIIVDEAQDTNPDAWRYIELLSPLTQIVCLADLDQQIFDHLPGIGPERIEAIKATLTPLIIDLGSDNRRSPGTEIALFGRDILTSTYRGKPYIGVSKFSYNPNPKTLDFPTTLRKAIGMLQNSIKKATGNWGESVAILCISGYSTVKVSAALNAGAKAVPHKLLFDETEALLAARFAAFLLEPTDNKELSETLGQALELLADMRRAAGVAEAAKLQDWSKKVRAGTMPKAAYVQGHTYPTGQGKEAGSL